MRNPLEGIARELANVASKLDAHIEERAAAKAAARIAEVEAATAAVLAEASAAHDRDRARWADLEAEFRRQVAAADRVRGLLIQERDLARAMAEQNRAATESAARWLDAAWALTKDTDGGDIDQDANIPIGELRRVLLETPPGANQPRPTQALNLGTRRRLTDETRERVRRGGRGPGA